MLNKLLFIRFLIFVEKIIVAQNIEMLLKRENYYFASSSKKVLTKLLSIADWNM